METPPELEAVAGEQDDITISTREYEDETVIVVDFGPVRGKPSVDIVGGTAIVTADEIHFEFDVPADASDVTVNDGVLTISG
ncbi:DUF7127 family protein [Natrinema gelatinilyticum]|uniref:DUF7127 family protein n=1 Tax=Natrinema gelatinilyticum TaxID=2961571 RepID=UPI0020C1D9DB|nr:hypothetical protein [Natrinema gelatinilyticum]